MFLNWYSYLTLLDDLDDSYAKIFIIGRAYSLKKQINRRVLCKWNMNKLHLSLFPFVVR